MALRFTNLTQSVAGMGITAAASSDCEAAGSGDKCGSRKTERCRRTSIVLGLLGEALLILSFASSIGLTFGGTEHAAACPFLSIAVFLTLVSGGQGALIQGMRRIADRPRECPGRCSVCAQAFRWCISSEREAWCASLVSVAAMTILTSWWYSRKIEVQAATATFSQVGRERPPPEARFRIMASGLMTMELLTSSAIIVLRKIASRPRDRIMRVDAGRSLCGFILQPWARIFYPA